jgi:DedD protein
MKWAFWRSEAGSGTAPGRGARAAADEADPGRIDPASALRIRARRRLIGAAALLLAAVIVVPMVLDPAPRPLPDTVPIDIPSEKTPFKPRLPLPPVPDPGPLQGGGPTEPASESSKAGEPAGKAADSAADKGADKAVDKSAGKSAADKPAEKAAAVPAARAEAGEAQRAREILEGKAAKSKAGEARYYVQAAAPRSEQAATELAARLKKAGLPSFTERVQASDGTRWRVRVGPYGSRQEAERVRSRLRELGTGADLIAP